MLNPVNTTMISVALVPISAALHVTSASVIWLVVALYLSSAIVQPVMGALSDHLGARGVFLAGLAIVLVLAFGWQAIFAVNIPIALIALVLGALWIPRGHGPLSGTAALRLREALDAVGILLFSGALLALLLFLLELQLRLWWLLAVFALAMTALILWERRRQRPFIDVRLMVSNGALGRTYVRILLTYLGPYVVVYAVSQWLQDDVHLTSASAGLVQVPSAILAGLASLAIARSRRVRIPLIVTAVVPVVGGLLLTVVTAGSPLWFIVIAASVFGITQGLASVSNQAVIYRNARAEQIGSAAGLSRTMIGVTAILASSLIALVFGKAPSDGGLHVLGWIVAGTAAVAVVLTVADRALRDQDR